MATFEQLFNQSVLSVIAPHASLGLPKQSDTLERWTEWLGRLEEETTDRKIAFFGKVHATHRPQILLLSPVTFFTPSNNSCTACYSNYIAALL